MAPFGCNDMVTIGPLDATVDEFTTFERPPSEAELLAEASDRGMCIKKKIVRSFILQSLAP